MAWLQLANNAQTVLGGVVSLLATSITPSSKAGFPDPDVDGSFYVTLSDPGFANPTDDSTRETVLVTANDGAAWTVTRAQCGTSAQEHEIADRVSLYLMAEHLEEIEAAVDLNTAARHAAVTVADTTSVDLTLTGQQLSAAVLPAGVNHDALAGFVGNEHIDWTENTGGVVIHAANYTDTDTTYTAGTGLALVGTQFATNDAQIDHNALLNYSADRHFLQTAIDHVSTGFATGLLKVATGTGALSVAVASDLPAHATAHESGGGDQVNHDSLAGFVANEHIDWTNASSNFKTTGKMSSGQIVADVLAGTDYPIVGYTSGHGCGRFASSAVDYTRVEIEAETTDADAQLAFMENSEIKWTLGLNGGESDVFTIKKGFGEFTPSDMVRLSTKGILVLTNPTTPQMIVRSSTSSSYSMLSFGTDNDDSLAAYILAYGSNASAGANVLALKNLYGDIAFHTGTAGSETRKMTINTSGDVTVAGHTNSVGGFKDNGTAGIDTTFVDNDGNTITVSGGIITAKTAP